MSNDQQQLHKRIDELEDKVNTLWSYLIVLAMWLGIMTLGLIL